MTLFTVTPQLKTVLEAHNHPVNDSISHTELILFYNTFHPTDSLLQLIRLTSIQSPKHETVTIAKSQQFIKSMNRLRLQQKEKEYQDLISAKSTYNTLYENRESQQSIAQMTKEANSHITTIFNIFISVASVMYAIWYWTDTSWKLPPGARVLLCLFFGLLILVAEVVVYMSYVNKIDTARNKEVKKKEVKKIIKTITF